MVKKNVLVHRAGGVAVGETSGFVDSAAQQWHQKPNLLSLDPLVLRGPLLPLTVVGDCQ